MVETSEKTGRILNIGYQNRYHPDSLFLKEMCKADELGEIYLQKPMHSEEEQFSYLGVYS